MLLKHVEPSDYFKRKNNTAGPSDYSTAINASISNEA